MTIRSLRRLAIVIAFVAVMSSCGSDAPATKRLPVVGVLNCCSTALGAPEAKQEFLAGLREYGYDVGRTIRVEFRTWAQATDALVAQSAAELVALPVDVIVANGLQSQSAAMAATKTIPIVIYGGMDPLVAGLVQSLARPGGNVTGIAGVRDVLAAKRLEYLKEAVPSISRVAILGDDRPELKASRRAVEGTARALGLEVITAEPHDATQLPRAFEAITASRADALLVLPGGVMGADLNDTLAYAAARRIPGSYPIQRWADAGGLMVYVDNIFPIVRRAGNYVARILNGEQPAGIPIEHPTQFELVINLKTARDHGIAISPSVLSRATRVIE